MFRRKRELYFSEWIEESKFNVFNYVRRLIGDYRKVRCCHTCHIPIVYYEWGCGIEVERLIGKPYITIFYRAVIPKTTINAHLIKTLANLKER